MSGHDFDVIVVGARCAGSPTAMLLARHGHRVLAVDKATFPSDTVSTHLIHPPGVAALRRWGLLDRVVATGCPPIRRYTFDVGPCTITGAPGADAEPFAYSPRRTALDELLLDAAGEAGAEVWEGFTVDEVTVDEGRVTGIRGHGRGGDSVHVRARVVVGADGFRSIVARAVDAKRYHERPPLLVGYYTYWSGLPMDGGVEMFMRPGRGFAAWPTGDDLTVVIAGWPHREFAANRADVEGHYRETLALAPGFAERLAGARPEERIAGLAVPNFFRQPYGDGWALVGDAGYTKDFITGYGMQDAFRDAELCATAIHESLAGIRPYSGAMAVYHEARDAHSLPMYEFTCELAMLEPPPPDLVRLLTAIEGDQAAMDEFAQLNAGVIAPADFFAPDHVARLLAG